MSMQLKVGLIFGFASLITMIVAYNIIDNFTIFWGVFLMLFASRLDQAGAKAIKDSREHKDG